MSLEGVPSLEGAPTDVPVPLTGWRPSLPPLSDNAREVYDLLMYGKRIDNDVDEEGVGAP